MVNTVYVPTWLTNAASAAYVPPLRPPPLFSLRLRSSAISVATRCTLITSRRSRRWRARLRGITTRRKIEERGLKEKEEKKKKGEDRESRNSNGNEEARREGWRGEEGK